MFSVYMQFVNQENCAAREMEDTDLLHNFNFTIYWYCSSFTFFTYQNLSIETSLYLKIENCYLKSFVSIGNQDLFVCIYKSYCILCLNQILCENIYCLIPFSYVVFNVYDKIGNKLNFCQRPTQLVIAVLVLSDLQGINTVFFDGRWSFSIILQYIL